MTMFYDKENRRVLKRIGNGEGYLLCSGGNICVALTGGAAVVGQNSYVAHFSGALSVGGGQAGNLVKFRRTSGSRGSISRVGQVVWSGQDRERAETALGRITRKRVDLS